MDDATSTTQATKHCQRCDTEKPLDGFQRDTRRPDGRRGTCAHCCLENDLRGNSVRRARGYGHEIFAERVHPDEVRAAYGSRCIYCPAEATQVDHVVPIADGGPHALVALRPICGTCNLRKSRVEKALRDARLSPTDVPTALRVYRFALTVAA